MILFPKRKTDQGVNKRQSVLLIPHLFFLAKKFLPPELLHTQGRTNESGPAKCSDSWFLGRTRFSPQPSILLPAFTLDCSKIGILGSRLQLQQRNCSRFSRDSIVRSTNIELSAKNCADR